MISHVKIFEMGTIHVCRRFIKGIPFWQEMVFERLRFKPLGGAPHPPLYITLLSTSWEALRCSETEKEQFFAA